MMSLHGLPNLDAACCMLADANALRTALMNVDKAGRA